MHVLDSGHSVHCPFPFPFPLGHMKMIPCFRFPYLPYRKVPYWPYFMGVRKMSSQVLINENFEGQFDLDLISQGPPKSNQFFVTTPPK